MKTEHEKLKEICDVIGYDLNKNYRFDYVNGNIKIHQVLCRIINVNEIIFTQEFMDKLLEKRSMWKIKATPCLSLKGTFYEGLMENLSNPVEYLYNLLELGTKQKKNG